VVPGDLLDHVDLGLGVVAPRRDLHVDVVAGRGGGEPDRIQHLGDASRGQLGAQEAGDASGAHAHGRPHGQGTGGDGGRVLERRAEELGEATHGEVDHLRITALLEARAGLGPQLVTTRRLHDPIGWNHAISSSTSVVASSISLLAPPMIPPRPTGRRRRRR
jgi:hypothetical protein